MLLRSGAVDVGSVVILSDGADVGSKAKLDVVLKDAQSSRTRIFAVGLASQQFDPKTLKAFAGRRRRRVRAGADDATT